MKSLCGIQSSDLRELHGPTTEPSASPGHLFTRNPVCSQGRDLLLSPSSSPLSPNPS